MLEHDARVAEERQDWNAAAQIWGAVLADGSANPPQCLRAARAFRMAGRLDEADRTLELVACLAPQDPELAVERAWLAQARGDWPQTLACWQVVRKHWPDQPESYAGEASVLRVMGRLNEAEDLVDAGAARFPTNPMFAVERGWIAQQRGDWTAAALRWDALRTSFPGLPAGYAGLATVLRVQGNLDAAERLLHDATERFPQDSAIRTEAAWLAQARGDLELAARRWDALRRERPHHIDAYLQQAACLHSLGRSQEASTVLAAGCASHPDDFQLHRAAAQLLVERHLWDAAQQAFAAIGARWPQQPGGLLGEAAALVGRGSVAEAEFRLRRAEVRFPIDVTVARALARLPVSKTHHNAGDWAEAARRLRRASQRFPSSVEVWSDLIEAESHSGACDAADATAEAAMRQFPDEATIALRWVGVAQTRADTNETVRRFRIAYGRHRAEVRLITGFAEALAQVGSHAEAAHVLGRVPARDRNSVVYMIAEATLATQRRAWDEVAERWAAAERRFPNDRVVAAAAARARLTAVEAGTTHIEDNLATPFGQDTAQAVIRRFESLGGKPLGCEFGFVQRALALEPLGLLRWTGVPPPRLVAALNGGFEGVGDPAQTELIRPASANEEYLLRDRHFGLLTHTSVTPAEVPPEDFFPRACLRQKFLRRRLLQRLAQGSHVFVYRMAQHDIAEDELLALHCAIRAHGPGTLLYVGQSRSPAEGNTVQQRVPGLLVGSIARFEIASSGTYVGAATEDWVLLCRRALALLSDAPTHT